MKQENAPVEKTPCKTNWLGIIIQALAIIVPLVSMYVFLSERTAEIDKLQRQNILEQIEGVRKNTDEIKESVGDLSTKVQDLYVWRSAVNQRMMFINAPSHKPAQIRDQIQEDGIQARGN